MIRLRFFPILEVLQAVAPQRFGLQRTPSLCGSCRVCWVWPFPDEFRNPQVANQWLAGTPDKFPELPRPSNKKKPSGVVLTYEPFRLQP